AKRDDRLALSPRREECGRNAGEPRLDPKSFLLQDTGQVLRCFEFLKSEFTEAEDRIHHDLRLLFHGVDLNSEVILQCGFLFGRDFLLPEYQTRSKKRKKKNFSYQGSSLPSSLCPTTPFPAQFCGYNLAPKEFIRTVQ